MSPNRVVAFLTPLVFAPLAGGVAAWLAQHFPGIDVPASAVEEVFIAGALIAFGKSAQWLNGWQKWEARQSEESELAAILAERNREVAAEQAMLDPEFGGAEPARA